MELIPGRRELVAGRGPDVAIIRRVYAAICFHSMMELLDKAVAAGSRGRQKRIISSGKILPGYEADPGRKAEEVSRTKKLAERLASVRMFSVLPEPKDGI